eukprot:scaffold83052_cov37-Tisochrysis_lutea.AAC.1
MTFRSRAARRRVPIAGEKRESQKRVADGAGWEVWSGEGIGAGERVKEVSRRAPPRAAIEDGGGESGRRLM